MPLQRPPTKSLFTRYLPIADWLPDYDWSESFRWDVVAGLTVWALLVPEAMAYAGIAGVPPQAGLYTAPLALLGYAIFGTSRQLFVGPSSTVAIVSASVVGGLVASGTVEFWQATSWLAIVTGIVLVLLGLARMGWVANFMSQPMLDGFLVGLAITIAVGQLDKMFGIAAEGENTVRELIDIITSVGEWDSATVVIGFVSLALLFALHRYMPKVPAALVVVVLAIAISAIFGFDEKGIHVVGEIPAGLPPIGFPDWPGGLVFGEIVVGALAVILVGYAESLAAAEQYAKKHGYEVDPNQEMIGLGVANFGAGMSQGFVVDGSLSKTAAGDDAGQRTQMAGIIAAAITVLTILFLTGLFFSLPEATLGAIVVHAVWKLIDFSKLQRIWRIRQWDFWAALAALLGVLLLGVLGGILLGVILSLLILIYRASFPTATQLGEIEVDGRPTYVSLQDTQAAVGPPGIVVHRFDADLLFANAGGFVDSVKTMLYDSDPPAGAVVIDCEQMSEIDMTGAARLGELVEELQRSSVDVRLARLHGDAYVTLERMGVLDMIGADHIHTTVAEAVDATEAARA